MAEKAICADPRLAKLDILVARNYKAALKRMDAVARAALKNDQQTFIETRNEDAEGDEVITDQDRFAIVSRLLSARAEFLGRIMPAPAGTIAGNWEGPSGYVRITSVDGGRLHVDLESYDPSDLRGVCGLDEIVPVTESLHIPDTDVDNKPNGTVVDIRRDGDVVTVDESVSGEVTGMSANCGVGGAFQGTFFFTRPE
jgi:hypothetical protein